jgi:PAS domain S-box-containing protein
MADKNGDGRGFILVVEDDRNTNRLETRRLEPLGMEIRSAYSGKEAVEMLKGGPPEMMLLDYSLPDMSALELLAELEKNKIQTPPFIFVTGKGNESVAVEAMKSGAQDYLVKDVVLQEVLLDRVNKALLNVGLRRELEQAKRLAEDERGKYKRIFESANDAVFVHGIGADGSPTNFIEVNDITCARLGYTREELLSFGPAEIDAEEMAEPRHKAVQELARDGRATFEAVHLAKDGRRIPVEISSRTFDYRGAKFILSIARDITERKRIENALKETAEIKSNFTSMVSHELRNPLGAIMLGVSFVLEEATGLTAEQRDMLEIATRNAERLGRLINDILDFQKMTAGKMNFDIRENDIGGIVWTTTRSMSLLAKNKGLELKPEISNALPKSMCDSDKIIQVLTNLLANAIAHTEKGIVTVHAGYENNMLQVSVRDTGIGIKADDLPKLFKPFEQLESGKGRKIGSTGLGLAISKEIILAHNGHIWAESEPGKGSVFHFTLPVAQGEG